MAFKTQFYKLKKKPQDVGCCSIFPVGTYGLALLKTAMQIYTYFFFLQKGFKF
jgi:hypothetical protein